MKTSEVTGIPFALLDWNDLDRLTRNLAKVVNDSGVKYDRIVPLANGGLTIARHFADLISLRVISGMQVALYRGVNETNAEPKVIQPLAVPISGEKILILEDIVDSGETLKFAVPIIRSLGAIQVDTASLFYKTRATVKPEYSAQLLDRWIIFPYETRETISELSQKWKTSGLSSEAVKTNLSTIGFAESDIAAYA